MPTTKRKPKPKPGLYFIHRVYERMNHESGRCIRCPDWLDKNSALYCFKHRIAHAKAQARYTAKRRTRDIH